MALESCVGLGLIADLLGEGLDGGVGVGNFLPDADQGEDHVGQQDQQNDLRKKTNLFGLEHVGQPPFLGVQGRQICHVSLLDDILYSTTGKKKRTFSKFFSTFLKFLPTEP